MVAAHGIDGRMRSTPPLAEEAMQVCQCDPGRAGTRCQYEAPCPVLFVEGAADSTGRT